ncbi:MAG: hypothetical protein K0S65_6602 [Labilithrix sp.]|nr:hypothetical protein [Labilithrix sp.]
MRSLVVFLGVASFAVVMACSEDPASSDDDAAVVTPDAGTDAPAATKKTSVEASMNDVARTLDRAQFGLTKEGATSTLYIEAHEGGVAECPEKETPKRTLIVSGVPMGRPRSKRER